MELRHYTVGTDGKVVNNITGLTLKGSNNGYGYLMVCLWMETKSKKTYYIHRLVAEAYLPNPQNYNQVNHKDGNKQNNAVENLEWCNQSQNLIHATELGLRASGKDAYNAKFDDSSIDEVFRLKKQGVYQKDIAKSFNVCASTIGYILKGKRYSKTINEKYLKEKSETI